MSELEIETVRMGDGRNYPRKGNNVRIHYSTQVRCFPSKLSTGEVIDASRSRNQPFCFQVGSGDVIEGLEEAVRKVQSCRIRCHSAKRSEFVFPLKRPTARREFLEGSHPTARY